MFNKLWICLYLDDLPIWGIVGDIDEKDKETYYLWTHKKFEIGYNGNQVPILYRMKYLD